MYLGLLSIDLSAFQERLHEWLLWYNCERPHEGIGLLSPLWYLVVILVVSSLKVGGVGQYFAESI